MFPELGYVAPAAYQVPVPALLVFHPAKTFPDWVKDPVLVARVPEVPLIVVLAGTEPVVFEFPL